MDDCTELGFAGIWKGAGSCLASQKDSISLAIAVNANRSSLSYEGIIVPVNFDSCTFTVDHDLSDLVNYNIQGRRINLQTIDVQIKVTIGSDTEECTSILKNTL